MAVKEQLCFLDLKHVKMTIYCAGTSMSLLALIWWSYQHIYLYCDRNLCFLRILVLDETVIIHALFKKYTEQQQQKKKQFWETVRGLLHYFQGRKEEENRFSSFLEGIRKDDRKLI